MNSHEADDLQLGLIEDLRDTDQEIADTQTRIAEEEKWLALQKLKHQSLVNQLRKTV